MMPHCVWWTTSQLMYINGLADVINSDKYGGHIFEMTRVIDQDGKTGALLFSYER